ncbi:MAG: divalent cation tolerance protein CutA [Candidatus Paceibacterota bacterium]|jgi:uncharacterized protein involved in tolerance to divalent cations
MSIFEKIEKGIDDIVFVYTICGSIDEARTLGYGAIQEKLAISMDYWVINSIYPWQGVIQEAGQYMLMFSTQKFLSDKLVKHIEAEHSYKIPMVARCNTDMTNVPYFMWVENTLKNDDKYITEEEEKVIKDTEENTNYNKLK